LIAQGHAKDMKTVFKRYLVKGKPGYVPHIWPAWKKRWAGFWRPAACR